MDECVARCDAKPDIQLNNADDDCVAILYNLEKSYETHSNHA
jgi:hypothetical protein